MKTEQQLWQTFLQTGQVRDYLQYKKSQQTPNPKRRIADSSRYKTLE